MWCRRVSGSARVRPEQASEAFLLRDGACNCRWSLKWLDQLVAEPLVRPLSVVVLDVFSDHVPYMLLPERYDPVEAFALDRSDEPLGVCVEVRAAGGEPNRFDTRRFQPLIDGFGEQ